MVLRLSWRYGGLSENIVNFVYVIGEKSARLISRSTSRLATGSSNSFRVFQCRSPYLMEVRWPERKYSLLCVCNWVKIGVIEFATSYVAIYRVKSRRVWRPEAVITSGFCSVILRTSSRYSGLSENIINFVYIIGRNRRG